MARSVADRNEGVRRGLLAVLAVTAAGAAGLFFIFNRGPDLVSGEVLTGARFPAAMVPTDDGGIVYGERLTGRIVRLDPDGEVVEDPVARVDVSIEGRRGLVGLALDEAERVFASWTDPDGVLLVGQVAPGPQRIVWKGPETTELALGGRIAFTPEGRLAIGVGNMGDADAALEPANPHGKLLTLDPDGPPDQQAEIVSGGWSNPLAFAFTDGGVPWIADDGPAGAPDRLSRADRDARTFPVTELPEDFDPTGLAAIGRRLYVCGFTSRRMLAYRIGLEEEAFRRGEALATNCSLDVVHLGDGRLAYSNEATILTLEP